MHWEIFDKDKSKSGSAVSLESTGGTINTETPYDVLQKPTDWQCGYSTFFVGTKLDNVKSADFLPGLTKHVNLVRSTFEPVGLKGYIVVGNENMEIAFMNWSSKAAADRAMSSPAGKNVVNDAGKIMKPYQFTGAVNFKNDISAGKFVNVKFQKRG